MSEQGLTVDSFGNLFVTSSTTIRIVAAGEDGVASGDDAVATIFGLPPRNTFPESVSTCLSVVSFAPGDAGQDIPLRDG